MIKIIFLIVKKALGTIILILTTIGGLSYLTKFDIAKFMEDNKPHSYFYGAMISFSVFCVFCLFLSLRELYQSRQEEIKGKENITTSNKNLEELKLEMKNLKQVLEKKNNQLKQHNKQQQHLEKSASNNTDPIVSKEFDSLQLLPIVSTLQTDLINIQERLITTYKFNNNGKVGPSHNNEFIAAKNRYLQCKHLIDGALEDYIKEYKTLDGSFPLRKIFVHSSLQSLSDTYSGKTAPYSYDNSAIIKSIADDFDKLKSLLISFNAFLNSLPGN